MSYAGGVGEANRVVEETRVFGVAEAQCSRIDRFIAVAEDLFFRTQFVARLIPNVYQSLVYLVLIGGLAVIYESGSSHVASLGAVVLLLVRAGLYGQQIQGSYTCVRQATPFIERLHEAEQRYIASSPASGQSPMSTVKTLTFESVSFAYQPSRPVLSEITFEVQRGEAVGVIGPSGAGKSTLVQILLNLRVPDEGRYLVNSVPVQQLRQDDWYARVAYVPQEPRLVHASVAENIRYFRDLDDDAVIRGAQLARIHDDIESWPNGYETIIGPRADAVSGGQQQRICLARALAAQPEILILDEPTSALDPRSEALIQESLTALKHKLTLFIIAHRMSTLDICDRVMVILDGRLDAFDTITQLDRVNTLLSLRLEPDRRSKCRGFTLTQTSIPPRRGSFPYTAEPVTIREQSRRSARALQRTAWRLRYRPPSSDAPPHEPILVVFGMHRSGTSAAVGVLEDLGFVVPGTMPPDGTGDNQRGTREPVELTVLTNWVLQTNASSWREPPKAAVRYSSAHMAERNRIVGVCTKEKCVLKDPRMLLMLDLWDGISIKPMGVVRNPIDVAESLVRRNEPLTIQQGVVLWKIYNRALLNFAQSRDCPIAFFDRPGFADQVKSCTYRLGYGKGNAARFFEEQL